MSDPNDHDIYDETPSKAISEFTRNESRNNSEMKTPVKKLSTDLIPSTQKRNNLKYSKTRHENTNSDDIISEHPLMRSEHSRSSLPIRSNQKLQLGERLD